MSVSEHDLNRGAPGETRGDEPLLTAEEAADRAEVSIETLRMFAQCGLLPQTVRDGVQYFTAADIGTLFYTRLKSKMPAATGLSGSGSREATTVDIALSDQEKCASAAESAPPASAADPLFSEPAETEPALAEPAEEAGQPSAGTAGAVAMSAVEPEPNRRTDDAVPDERAFGSPAEVLDRLLAIHEAARSAGAPTLAGGPSSKPDGSHPQQEKSSVDFIIRPGLSESEPFGGSPGEAEAQKKSPPPSGDATGSRDSQEMPDPFEMGRAIIEVNKGLREQIQILRDERDWLRRRIEQLEARSEREQMLLLSESETIRNLVSRDKRSFWQRALPWFTGRRED